MAATWNPADKHADITLSNGDMTATWDSSGFWNKVRANISKTSDKWYWEETIDAISSGGILGAGLSTSSLLARVGDDKSHGYHNDGRKVHDNNYTAYGNSWTTSDVIGIALDMDNGKIWFAKNGVWQASGDPAAGINEAFSGISGAYYPMDSAYSSNYAVTINFGATAFSHSAPSGFSGPDEPEVIEVNLVSPLSGTAQGESNINVKLVPPVMAAAGSMTVEKVREGFWVDCIDALGGEATGQSNLNVKLVPGALAGVGSLSIDRIREGFWVDLVDPFGAVASGEGNISVGIKPGILEAASTGQSNTKVSLVPGTLSATGSLDISALNMSLFAGVLGAAGSLADDIVATEPFTMAHATRLYLFTLTGSEDGETDIEIPISSFQSRATFQKPEGTFYPAESADDGFRIRHDTLYNDLNYIAVGEYVSELDYDSWIRFNSINISHGDLILNAFVRLTAYDNQSGTLSGTVAFNDADNAVNPTDYYDFGDKERTAKIDWNMPDMLSDEEYDTPDLASILQTVIDRPGWESDSAIMAFIETSDDNNSRSFWAWDGNTGKKAELHITWGETTNVSTFLKVIIPGDDYVAEINARPNGSLIVYMAYVRDGEILLKQEVASVDFEDMRIDREPTNELIILSGHRNKLITPKTVNLAGTTYSRLDRGKLKYRCLPDLYLQPGDTANIGDDSFIVGSVVFTVNVAQEQYEVNEV